MLLAAPRRGMRRHLKEGCELRAASAPLQQHQLRRSSSSRPQQCPATKSGLRGLFVNNKIINNDNNILSGFFSYDGYYSETDRTGTVQKTIHLLKCATSMQHPPPHSHDVKPHLIMATCLCKSTLLVAELDSCLHPRRASDAGPYPGKCLRHSPFFSAL